MTTTTVNDDVNKTQTITKDGERIVMRDGKEIFRTKIMEDQVYTYSQVEEIKAEYESKIKDLEEEITAKDSEIEEIGATALRIAELKVKMADNPYTKDFSDADYLDDDKISMAETKFENDQLKAKLKEKEVVTTDADTNDEEVATETASENQDNDELATGHEEKDEKKYTTEDVVKIEVARIKGKIKK